MNLPSQHFQPRIYGLGAWTDNLHFAHDLVAAMRPHRLVELGTDRGESYFAFCQAALENETGTRSFAIDTWRGDDHSGAYDETTFAEVAAHNDAHYRTFSTLLRSTFDAACARFEPQSIEVLHIDGLHTEAAVRHDFDTWLPKVAPGGIVLLHDVSVRARDFGVWKLWAELVENGRAYTFAAGPGLGVWQKPPARILPKPLETLLAGPSARREQLANYYRGQAESIQQRIAEDWRSGRIRQTAAAGQTTIQIFHSRDGAHSEENSVFARIGHEGWKEISMQLPIGAGGAPLRIDFLSALTTIELSMIRVWANGDVIFAAETSTDFDRIRVAGDAQHLPHPQYLRLQITGVDPQLYLPPIAAVSESALLRAELRLRVSRDAPDSLP